MSEKPTWFEWIAFALKILQMLEALFRSAENDEKVKRIKEI